MVINELVDNIIQKRGERLPEIRERIEMLQNLIKALEEFDYFKSQIVDSQGNAVNGKFNAVIAKHPDVVFNLNTMSTEYCKEKINNALAKLREAEKRFARDRINISVVGHARIGKSRFLQSVSNLPNEVIPAFDDTDCTGAVSIIQNVPKERIPGGRVEARITFKSEAEMIKVVQEYLDKLITQADKKIVLRSIYDIKNLDLDDVKSRMTPGSAVNNLLKNITNFKNHFEEWAACIKLGETVLHDEKEIMTYVAQNNGVSKEKATKKNPRLEFYKYLAVKTCEIDCVYDYKEAGKVTLIDTIGFGDNALGIEEGLVDVVNNRSDAAIFMLYPMDMAGGGVSSEITRIYDQINTNINNKDLDKWLFWLINYAPKHPKMPNNPEFCETTLQTIKNSGWHSAMEKIIDVSNQEQVREEFLIPLLNILLANLDDIDSKYLQEAGDALEIAKREYMEFYKVARNLMSGNITASSGPQITLLKDSLKRTISTKLVELTREYYEKRDEPCKRLYEDVSKIVKDMHSGAKMPDKMKVDADLTAEHDQATTVYDRYCNYIRNDLVKKFSDVDMSLDELVIDFKNNIANILISNEGGRLGEILNPNENKNTFEWLNDFAESCLDEKTYPNLYYAFKTLYNFEFSVKGFLTYEVRACLDSLDPAYVSFIAPQTPDRIDKVNSIVFQLKRNLINVSDTLQKQLRDLLNKPNRAFFAAVKEFSDQVYFSEGVKYEWDAIFSENCSLLWAEEYNQMIQAEANFKEWKAILDTLAEYSQKINKLSF